MEKVDINLDVYRTIVIDEGVPAHRQAAGRRPARGRPRLEPDRPGRYAPVSQTVTLWMNQYNIQNK